MKYRLHLVFWLSLMMISHRIFATEPSPVRPLETPEQHDARMAFFRDAKFGMFIHWGLYAIPADTEWHMRVHKKSIADYSKFAEQFNPVKFNADEWASIAEAAGMKYMVPTAKHHDGFAMYHSEASKYNIYDATPFHRDPLKELAEVCPKHGIRLGIYYSVIADWGHSGGGAGCPKWDKAQDGSMDDYINNVSLPQVKELLTNYGPIAELWFDFDGTPPEKQAQALAYVPVLQSQPNMIINPRLRGIPGDFETCEGRLPMFAPEGDWEFCYQTNGSWGYRAKPALPLKTLLLPLCEAWGKGGNVLLNVGPNKDGEIPADSVEQLKQIGAWLKVNGEAIYGSKRGPFEFVPWGWQTVKGDMLYLLVSDWPANGILKLPTETSVEKGWLLANPNQKVAVEVKDGRTVLSLPLQAPDANVSVVALKMNAPVPKIQAFTIGCQVTDSENKIQKTLTSRGVKWVIAKTDGSLTLDLGKPQTFDTVRLFFPPKTTEVKEIVLEVKSGETWTQIFKSEQFPALGRFVQSFPPITGQWVRLTIHANKPDIRLECFELFPPL